jgi:predicted phosphoadenosine phosphosulfate sulfurtransferase
MPKRYLGISVLEAARQRIAWTFDTFPRIYVSCSYGKDSTVMLHLVMDEAIKRGRKVGMMFLDLEGQYKLTIAHGRQLIEMYQEYLETYWIALPIHLRNAVSTYQHHWIAWNPDRREDWIREPPDIAITDQNYFPFYKYACEFEDFVPDFGTWYAQDQWCACFVGIRTAESLNRWRTIAGHGRKFEDLNWTNYVQDTVVNVYPIYDWKTQDIWVYHGKFPDRPYNRLYDYMHRAGLSIHKARICQPYGDDQRQGLWLFHIIEPETWARIVARVNGANQGALYANTSGNILGRIKIDKPEGHTWESFAHLLLDSMPPKISDHYKNKIAVFLHWNHVRDYPSGIPDESEPKLEAAHKAPSWRRICKALLRNDYWCKGLSFSMHKSGNYERYSRMMKKRRQMWGIYPE